MARRLQAAGFQILVWARSHASAAKLEALGLRSASLEEVASCQVLITCLRDTEAVTELFLEGTDDQLPLADTLSSALVIDHATYDPAVATQLRQRLAQRGIELVDAPVSGGPAGAEAGNLVAMVGASTTAYEQASEILQHTCAKAVHVGAAGSGLTLKLINQHLVAVHSVAAAEAAALLRHHYIDPRIAREALMGGWAASTRLSIQLEASTTSDYTPDGAGIDKFMPLLDLVGTAFDTAGIQSALLSGATSTYQEANTLGDDLPFAALAQPYHAQAAAHRQPRTPDEGQTA